MFETWRCQRCGPIADYRAPLGNLRFRCQRCEGEMTPLAPPQRTPPPTWGVPVEIDHELTPPPQRQNLITADDWNALVARVVELGENPLQLLEARIATASLDELQALNEQLEALGVRMVERAGELRARLKS